MPDDDVVARMKHHVRGVLANLSAMMPCFSLGGYKLPKVTGKISRAADSPSRVSSPPFLHHHHLAGGACNPPCPTAWVGTGIALPPQPRAPWGAEHSWVSSPPQFPTTTRKSPSTPASLSRRQLRGFQTAPSPPSTPTTRDPSTPSLPEKVTSMTVPPLPSHPQPFWAARGQPCPITNLGCPRDGCWAQAAFIFILSFSCPQGHTGAVLGLM